MHKSKNKHQTKLWRGDGKEEAPAWLLLCQSGDFAKLAQTLSRAASRSLSLSLLGGYAENLALPLSRFSCKSFMILMFYFFNFFFFIKQPIRHSTAQFPPSPNINAHLWQFVPCFVLLDPALCFYCKRCATRSLLSVRACSAQAPGINRY